MRHIVHGVEIMKRGNNGIDRIDHFLIDHVRLLYAGNRNILRGYRSQELLCRSLKVRRIPPLEPESRSRRRLRVTLTLSHRFWCSGQLDVPESLRPSRHTRLK
jgi:hypothetical protein